jgi:hypothetical protein
VSILWLHCHWRNRERVVVRLLHEWRKQVRGGETKMTIKELVDLMAEHPYVRFKQVGEQTFIYARKN